MVNKEGKTFTDIFSSASDTNTIAEPTFTDILNSDEVAKKQENQPITFDNLFDQSMEYNDEDNTSHTQEEISLSTFNPFESETSISTEESDITTDDNITSENSSAFSDFSKNPFTNSEGYQMPEENPFFKGSYSKNTDYNPFFDDSAKPFNSEPSSIFDFNQNVKTQTSNESVTLDGQVSQVDSLTSESTSNNNQEENPFFTNNTQTNDTNIISISDTNQSTASTESPENPTPEVQDSQTVNPFFEETNNANQEENPFFTNNTKTNDTNTISILDTNQSAASTEPPENPTPEVQDSQTVSPFFEETNNANQEENPFFQNQINLIENQAPPSSNSNIDTTKSKHYSVKIVKKKEPLIKTILGVLSYALFIWLLLVGVALLIYVLDIKIRAAKGDYSSPTFNAYVVLTGSMLPEIKVNDVVVTKKVDASELKERDIITFASADPRFQGTIITHRIIKKNPPTETEGYTFQTKGDNNNVADNALVPENNIYGKVILKIPKLGYLQEFLAKDGGWIVVILLPCLTVMSYDIVKLIKGIKRKKYKNIKVQK